MSSRKEKSGVGPSPSFSISISLFSIGRQRVVVQCVYGTVHAQHYCIRDGSLGEGRGEEGGEGSWRERSQSFHTPTLSSSSGLHAPQSPAWHWQPVELPPKGASFAFAGHSSLLLDLRSRNERPIVMGAKKEWRKGTRFNSRSTKFAQTECSIKHTSACPKHASWSITPNFPPSPPPLPPLPRKENLASRLSARLSYVLALALAPSEFRRAPSACWASPRSAPVVPGLGHVQMSHGPLG
ncbi:hypothetical protein K431DRAFT_58691 [Polychaeton citri CBS 116435]|uniref:Uncharacterized protein n=1 Tax=Polychaeton citri CBS 116435 TaxID=1314669 RepID=A0A9P4Q9Q0_9PEZI|nr:hypothetical protein K431DRAFT_58691 [Polychaeton citri CBS 116435]